MDLDQCHDIFFLQNESERFMKVKTRPDIYIYTHVLVSVSVWGSYGFSVTIKKAENLGI